jgi:hypothetical protein
MLLWLLKLAMLKIEMSTIHMVKNTVSSPICSLNTSYANHGHFEVALSTLITQSSTTTMS